MSDSSSPVVDFCRVVRLADKVDVVFMVDTAPEGFSVSATYPRDNGALARHSFAAKYETRTAALRAVEEDHLTLIAEIQ